MLTPVEAVRRKFQRNALELEQLERAVPRKVEDRLEAYRANPSLLMCDAGFTPDHWQAGFLNSREQLNLMLCSRQCGKSTTVAILALHTALTQSDATVIVIAPIESQANELIRKVLTAYNRIGRPMALIREAVTTLEFTNGSRIIALPGKERSVHSYSASLLLIDEAARVPDSVFAAASPQLSVTKGRLVALSTAFSKSGWFYSEWDTGEGYRRWSVTADQCPRHSEAFLRGEKRRMGPRYFDMAYRNVFGDDVAAVFRLEDIQAARDDDLLPYFAGMGGERIDSDDDEIKPYFVR